MAASQMSVTACTYGKSRVRVVKNERGPMHKLQARASKELICR